MCKTSQRKKVSPKLRFAVQRLQRDYAEYEASKGDFANITAAPMAMLKPDSHSMVDWLEWHVNLSPEDGPFKGGKYHLIVRFPPNYPLSAPKATMCSPIPHNHVYGTWICLNVLSGYIADYQAEVSDIIITPCGRRAIVKAIHHTHHSSEYELKYVDGEFETGRAPVHACRLSEEDQGWSYAYSVSSVLMQLSSFLFDETQIRNDKAAQQSSVASSLKFKCALCGHAGTSPVPAPVPTDEDGNTPLILAALNGDLEAVQDLLKAGSNPDQADDEGCTALIMAAQNDHLLVAQELLKAGVDVAKSDDDGDTPLTIAAANGCLAIVLELLKAGSDPEQGNNEGCTPLILAVQNEHLQIAQDLLQSGADVNKPDEDGDTPLIVAAINGHLEFVRMLRNASAEVEMANNDGHTALVAAANNGHLQIVRELTAAAPVDGYLSYAITVNMMVGGTKSEVPPRTKVVAAAKPVATPPPAKAVSMSSSARIFSEWGGGSSKRRQATRAKKTPLFGRLRVSVHMLRHIFGFMSQIELEHTFPCISRNVRKAVYLFSAQTILRKQLKCAYTTLGYESDTLGYGVNLTYHHSSTSSVKDINAVFPTLLSTAAIRDGIAMSAYKQSFSKWMPVYINPSHGRRALAHAIRSMANIVTSAGDEHTVTDETEIEMSLDEYYHQMSLSQTSASDRPKADRPKVHPLIDDWNKLATGRTQKMSTASYDVIMTVCGKLCNSTIVGMMTGDVHESIEALVGYFRWVHLFLGFCERDPGLRAFAQKKLQAFLGDESFRSKKIVPALGELLPFGILLGKPWVEIVQPFLDEAFVRNARWVINKFPEMGDLQQDRLGPNPASARRSRASFEANAVSLKLFAFHCTCTQLLQSLCPKNMSGRPPPVSDIKNALDLHFGTPTPSIVSNLQLACKQIKGMGDWATFFKSVQLNAPSSFRLCQWLRNSISASQKKGYHSWGYTLRKLKEARSQQPTEATAVAKTTNAPVTAALLVGGYPNPHRNWQR
jgi:ubiquitin-protein ligase